MDRAPEGLPLAAPAHGVTELLVLAPAWGDAAALEAVLRRAFPGQAVVACSSLDDMLARLGSERPLAAVLTEEALPGRAVAAMAAWAGAQPAWSDFPFVVLLAPAADPGTSRRVGTVRARLTEALGNATLLERPVRIAEIESVLASACRARRRQLELRDRMRELQHERDRLQAAVDGAGVAIWDHDLRTGTIAWSREHFVLLGLDPPAGAAPAGIGPGGGLVPVELWRSRVHPDDLARYRTASDAAAAEAASRGVAIHRDTYRVLLPDGAVRWVESHGRFRGRGRGVRPDRCVGVALDITERKSAEERQTLLMREVDHRANNALAVVQAVVRMVRTSDPADFVRAVETRVAVMARAQSRLTAAGWTGVDLRDVVDGELAKYRARTDGGLRISIAGPPATLAAIAVQPLSLVLHELGENAARHGSLAIPEGHLEVTWAWERVADGQPRLRMHWNERDGLEAPSSEPWDRRGLGLRLIRATVKGQLAGTVDFRWSAAGLCVELLVAGQFVAASADAFQVRR